MYFYVAALRAGRHEGGFENLKKLVFWACQVAPSLCVCVLFFLGHVWPVAVCLFACVLACCLWLWMVRSILMGGVLAAVV